MRTATTQVLDIQSRSLQKAALFFRAINHNLRQKMLRRLDKEGDMTVTALYLKLRVEQSVCSQQLAILREAKLVLTRREGRQIFYSVNYRQVKYLNGIAEQILDKK